MRWCRVARSPGLSCTSALSFRKTAASSSVKRRSAACSSRSSSRARSRARGRRRIRAGREDQLQGRRKVLDEECERQVTFLALDHVIVVQHQDRRTGQRGELVEQQRQHGVEQAHARSPQRRQRMPPDGRIDPVERLHHVGQQAQRIVVALVEVHPAGRAARPLSGAPRRQQGRLAEAGRCAHQGELLAGPGAEGRKQMRTSQGARARRRRMELRLQEHRPGRQERNPGCLATDPLAVAACVCLGHHGPPARHATASCSRDIARPSRP